jgi:RnfABCDGE-type electron transport complex G subunit
VFRCSGQGDETVGYAVVAEGPGFVDKIRLVTGLNSDLSEITGIKVIENVETPGLGNKIEKNKFADQYIGMTLETEIKVKKGGAVNDNNEIDAITGATWSSKYVTAIVNEVRTEAVPVIRETLQ